MTKSLISNPGHAAIASLVLAFPFSSLFLMLILGMEPDIESLEIILNLENKYIGSIIFLGTLVLMLAGFAISSASVIKGIKAGHSLFQNPVNLLLSIIIFLVILSVTIMIVVD